jgi:hypothetical protein
VRAASDRFEHLGTAPDTTVNIDFDLVADCIGYFRPKPKWSLEWCPTVARHGWKR